MTTTARTTPDPSAQVGWPRRTLGVLCLGLPALAVLAFGGQLLILGWLDTRPDGTFHVHDLAWGSAEGILLLVALVAASWNPRRLPAALQQALVVVGALLLTMVLTMAPDPITVVLGALVVTGALLSPGRSLLLPRSDAVNRPLIGLTVVAAVALLPYALFAAAAQRQGGSPHAELAGYTGAAVWALALLGTVGVAAMQTRGWQLPALSAAAAAAVMGVAALLWPVIPSSLGRPGGLLAIVWAGAVVAVVIRSRARSAKGVGRPAPD